VKIEAYPKQEEVLMARKTIGIVLLVSGIVIMAVSLFADVLGVTGNLSVGWKQLVGVGVGVIVTLVGVWLAWRKSQQTK